MVAVTFYVLADNDTFRHLSDEELAEWALEETNFNDPTIECDYMVEECDLEVMECLHVEEGDDNPDDGAPYGGDACEEQE
jgi:hypothetical protein